MECAKSWKISAWTVTWFYLIKLLNNKYLKDIPCFPFQVLVNKNTASASEIVSSSVTVSPFESNFLEHFCK